MMKQYSFSIIVPVYRAEKYLMLTVDSLLRQSYKNFEVIFIDDGSPDNCPLICDNLSKEHSFMKVIHQNNAGVSAARNAGILQANNDIICFLDADDEWSNDHLEKLNTLFVRYPEIGSASTGRYEEYSDGACETIVRKQPSEFGVIDDILILSEFGHLRTSSYCVKKDILLKAGLFRVGIKRGEDVDVIVRVACLAKHGYVALPLTTYRVGTLYNSDNAPIDSYFPFYEFYSLDYPYKKSLLVFTGFLMQGRIIANIKAHQWKTAYFCFCKTKVLQYVILRGLRYIKKRI